MTGRGHRPAPGEVRLWYTDAGASGGTLPARSLAAEELDRAGRFRFEADRRRYLLGRCMLRTVLASSTGREPGGLVFQPGPAGKPRLMDEPPEGLHFNVSHSGDIVIVAVASGREVGVDIELIRCPVPGIDAYRRYLAPGELALIDGSEGLAQAKAFYRTWTRKEALLKATGEGLGGLGPELDTSARNDFYRTGKAWHVADLYISPDYAVALAVEGQASTVQLCQWHP